MGVEGKVTTVNRAKVWQIGLFAFNNTATNTYMFLMGFVAYYLTGIVGCGVVFASNLIMAMRLWDGVTDPICGFLVDKMNGKLGKFRPFIIMGNIILAVCSLVMFFVTPSIPQGGRLIFFIGMYMIYMIGYTFQCCPTKAAQSALTSDPAQRPVFAAFDMVYNAMLTMIYSPFLTGVLYPKHGGFNEGFYKEAVLITVVLSGVLTVCAVIGIWEKDRPEFFGVGTMGPSIGFKDYVDVLKHNRGIQMLVVAASTDKLCLSIMNNATVAIIIFGIIIGNYATFAQTTALLTIPTILVGFVGVKFASKMGQKAGILAGTYGGMICMGLIFFLFVFGEPTTYSFTNISFFTVAFVVLYILMRGFMGIAGNLVIPMTADCADYEVYRSGRYVPGLMGTLFSFVDKLISSFAATFVGFAMAAIGFVEELPTDVTPYSTTLFWVGLALFCGAPMFGWLCNIIAMKFYPLNQEKMKEVRAEIDRIKATQSN